jgi:hypothetical protein
MADKPRVACAQEGHVGRDQDVTTAAIRAQKGPTLKIKSEMERGQHPARGVVLIRGIMHLTYHDPSAHTGVVSAEAAEAGAPEIEVTPAMIEAGVSTLCEIDSSFYSDVEIVRSIYLAMVGAGVKSS